MEKSVPKDPGHKMKLAPMLSALLISVVVRAEMSVKYYYVEPDAETYTPITQDNIKEAASFKGELQGRDAEYFLSLASHAKRDGKFDPNFVRLLIESSDGRNVIFIDKFAVATNNGKEYPVNPRIFIALESGLDISFEGRPHPEISYKDWLKISSLREEIPVKLREGSLDRPWLNFSYGLGLGALITLLALLIRDKRRRVKLRSCHES